MPLPRVCALHVLCAGTAGDLQTTLDELCQRGNHNGYVARYDVTGTTPGTPAWRCYYGPDLDLDATARGCANEAGQCSACSGVYDATVDTDSYSKGTHEGEVLSTKDAILAAIKATTTVPFFCPANVAIYWNTSAAGTLTIMQNTIVT